MQTQLSIKHLGYGLAPLTLLMAFGFLSSSEHGSITGGVA